MAGAHSHHMEEVIVVTVHGGKARINKMFEGNFSVSTKSRQKKCIQFQKAMDQLLKFKTNLIKITWF